MTHEQSSKKRPAGHVRVRDALRRGWRAEGFEPESNPSRRARAARVVASMIRLNPTQRELRQAQEAYDTKHSAEYAAAQKAAQGANKKLLDLIARSDAVPTNRADDVIADPRGRTMIIDPQNTDQTQFQRIAYTREFVINPHDFNDGKEGAGRLFTTDGKPLTLTVNTADGNQVTVPVSRLSVVYDAPNEVGADGKVVPGAGKTTVTINERPYDIENTRMYTGRGVDTQINRDGTMDGQVRFNFNADGSLGEVHLGRNNLDTMQQSPGTTVDAQAFVNNLDYLVFDNQMRIPDDLSGI